MSVTTWRPDSCGCEVKYILDPTSGLIFQSANRVGPELAHQSVAGSGQLLFNTILEENQRKNMLLASAYTTVSGVTISGQPAQDILTNFYQWFLDNPSTPPRKLYAFFGSGGRTTSGLTVAATSFLTSGQRASLRTSANTLKSGYIVVS